MLLCAFRAGSPFERIVGVPSLWPRPRGVSNSTGWAFPVNVTSNSWGWPSRKSLKTALSLEWKTPGSFRRFRPYEDRLKLLRQITSDGEVIEEDQSVIESGVPSSDDLPVAL
jgi:hypothetical protein